MNHASKEKLPEGFRTDLAGESRDFAESSSALTEMFLLALALERWGLHRRLAIFVLSRLGGAPRRLVVGFALTAVTTGTISFASAAASFVAIVAGVLIAAGGVVWYIRSTVRATVCQE